MLSNFRSTFTNLHSKFYSKHTHKVPFVCFESFFLCSIPFGIGHTQNRSLSKAWVLGSCFSLLYFIQFIRAMPPHILCNPKPYGLFFFVSFWISLAFDSVQFGRSVDLLHIGNRNTQKLLGDISIYLFFFSLCIGLFPRRMRTFFSQSFHFHYTIRPNCRIARERKKKRRKRRDEVCNWDTADVYSNKILCTTTITIIKNRILQWILANFFFCSFSHSSPAGMGWWRCESALGVSVVSSPTVKLIIILNLRDWL